MRRLLTLGVVGVMFCSVTFAEDTTKKDDLIAPENLKEYFRPLTSTFLDIKNPEVQAQVQLGKKLYFEKRLSENGTISCNSCHDLKRYGVDGLPVSPGHKGQLGARNSPTVFNSALHATQFWDGRAENLEAQAGGPILNPGEMAIPDEATAVGRIKEKKEYTALFQKAYPNDNDPITFKNITQALANFEKTLLTPSRFDSYLQGNLRALSTKEKKGLKEFVSLGCIACHTGEGIGGSMFQKLGLVEPYNSKVFGRYEVTKNDEDRFFFRVPSLRNVAKTAPYFHDGSVKNLKEAVRLMGKHQLGVKLKPEQVNSIVAFLGSLTGKAPKI